MEADVAPDGGVQQKRHLACLAVEGVQQEVELAGEAHLVPSSQLQGVACAGKDLNCKGRRKR